jgi:hypothetical protein
MSAQQLKDVDIFGKQDPYCKVSVNEQIAYTKSITGDTQLQASPRTASDVRFKSSDPTYIMYIVTDAGCYAVWNQTLVLNGTAFNGETLRLQVRAKRLSLRQSLQDLGLLIRASRSSHDRARQIQGQG